MRDVFERPVQPSGLAGDVEEFEVRPGGQLLGVIRCQVGQNAQVQFRGAELGAGRFTEGLFGLCERCQRLPAEPVEPFGDLKRSPLGPHFTGDGVGYVAGNVRLPPVARALNLAE